MSVIHKNFSSSSDDDDDDDNNNNNNNNIQPNMRKEGFCPLANELQCPSISRGEMLTSCIQKFRTSCLERELQMVQLSATWCSCIAIL
jgi:hypothetical protein